MIGHIIFLISFASVVLMTAEYYRRKSERFKIEADFVRSENGRLINRLLKEKINNRSLTFQNTNTKTVLIKEIKVAIPKDVVTATPYPAKDIFADILVEKIIEQDIVKVKEHNSYYECSVRFIENHNGG